MRTPPTATKISTNSQPTPHRQLRRPTAAKKNKKRGLSAGSAERKNQFTRDPWWTSASAFHDAVDLSKNSLDLSFEVAGDVVALTVLRRSLSGNPDYHSARRDHSRRK